MEVGAEDRSDRQKQRQERSSQSCKPLPGPGSQVCPGAQADSRMEEFGLAYGLEGATEGFRWKGHGL